MPRGREGRRERERERDSESQRQKFTIGQDHLPLQNECARRHSVQFFGRFIIF
jgi:hypothetical protein